MEVLGSWCVIGKPGSRSHTKVSPDFPPCTETIPVQPEQLNMAQKVHLWVSGMSLSGHHPPPTQLKSSIRSSTPEPLPLAQGSPKWFLLRGKSSIHCLVCEKIKDVWPLLSWMVPLKGGRMSFTANFGVLIMNGRGLLQGQYWAKSREKCVHREHERATSNEHSSNEKGHSEESLILDRD